MIKLYKVFIYLVMAMGITHIALTPVFYKTYTVDSLWFAGTGLAFVLLGGLNLAGLKFINDKEFRWIVFANILMLTFVGLLALKLGEPQGYAALILLHGVMLASAAAAKSIN